MSDRYIIQIICPYCNEAFEDFWYAPGCGSESHDCVKCRRRYFVVDCMEIKSEEVQSGNLLDAFLDSLNMWSPNEEEQRGILEEYETQVRVAQEHNASRATNG